MERSESRGGETELSLGPNEVETITNGFAYFLQEHADQEAINFPPFVDTLRQFCNARRLDKGITLIMSDTEPPQRLQMVAMVMAEYIGGLRFAFRTLAAMQHDAIDELAEEFQRADTLVRHFNEELAVSHLKNYLKDL